MTLLSSGDGSQREIIPVISFLDALRPRLECGHRPRQKEIVYKIYKRELLICYPGEGRGGAGWLRCLWALASSRLLLFLVLKIPRCDKINPPEEGWGRNIRNILLICFIFFSLCFTHVFGGGGGCTRVRVYACFVLTIPISSANMGSGVSSTQVISLSLSLYIYMCVCVCVCVCVCTT